MGRVNRPKRHGVRKAFALSPDPERPFARDRFEIARLLRRLLVLTMFYRHSLSSPSTDRDAIHFGTKVGC
jgi:hypothetical protein